MRNLRKNRRTRPNGLIFPNIALSDDILDIALVSVDITKRALSDIKCLDPVKVYNFCAKINGVGYIKFEHNEMPHFLNAFNIVDMVEHNTASRFDITLQESYLDQFWSILTDIEVTIPLLRDIDFDDISAINNIIQLYKEYLMDEKTTAQEKKHLAYISYVIGECILYAPVDWVMPALNWLFLEKPKWNDREFISLVEDIKRTIDSKNLQVESSIVLY